MTDHAPDPHHPPGLAPDDDRRPLVAALRCRQALAATLTNDVGGLHMIMRTAMAELGDLDPVVGGVLVLVDSQLPAGEARDALLSAVRAGIPPLLARLEAESPPCGTCRHAPATMGAACANCVHQAAMDAWRRDHGQPDQ